MVLAYVIHDMSLLLICSSFTILKWEHFGSGMMVKEKGESVYKVGL